MRKPAPDGGIKVKSKSVLAVEVHDAATSAELHAAAIEKHTDYCQQFKYKADELHLTYPDEKLVQFMPGAKSTTLFNLNKYQAAMNKPYNRLYFYLCPKQYLDNKGK